MSRARVTMPRLRDLWTDAVAASVFARTVDVYLGPIVSGDPDDAVFVGYDGNPFGDMEMVVHSQDWGTIGAKNRDENFDIRCCVLNRSGLIDPKSLAAAIDRLYGMFAVLADAVHRDPSLGLGITPFTASIRGLSSFVPLDETDAVQPRVSFNVHVRTRLPGL